MSIVLRFWTGDPPAPYVTDTNVGSIRDSSASARPRLRSPSSVRGGKNSNEKEGSVPAARRSSIRIGGSLGRAVPDLRLCARPNDQSAALEVGQPAERLVEQPGRGVGPEQLAVDSARELERGQRPGGERAADGVQALGDERAVGLD